ncbi:MAG: hypothetical protein ABIG44_16370 [Planctomycetota bacterium]
MRHTILATIALTMCFSSGCVSYHAGRLMDQELGATARAKAAVALGGYYYNPRAREVLLKALLDEDPTVRYFATEAIERPLNFSGIRRINIWAEHACIELLRLLEDNERGWRPLPQPLSLKLPTAPTAPIRYRATLTLAAVSNTDHGLDAEAWRAELIKQMPLLGRR